MFLLQPRASFFGGGAIYATKILRTIEFAERLPFYISHETILNYLTKAAKYTEVTKFKMLNTLEYSERDVNSDC